MNTSFDSEQSSDDGGNSFVFVEPEKSVQNCQKANVLDPDENLSAEDGAMR